MIPQLALLLGCGFIWWLFRMDMRWRQLPGRALWIPAVWLALASSRQISFWLGAIGLGGGASSQLEGNPVNAVFNSSLFLMAILVLNRRGFNWAQFISDNKALFAVFAFFLCSVLWSPFPLPTLKRLIQEFGCVLIAPIILTAKDPGLALRTIFARVSYILFPLSVVFMRFFPSIGRNISPASGTQMMSGVADHKNTLGQLAMVFCLVLLWDLMETRDNEPAPRKRAEHWARLVNLGIGFYLLFVSSSATSLGGFAVGLTLLFTGKRLARMKSARRVFVAGAVAIVGVLILNEICGISRQISLAFGRGENMSGRRQIWEKILEKNTDYVVGAGFHGFWETTAGESVWKELQTNRLVSSHNGYLETYLNGGVVGLILLGVFLSSAGLSATDKLVKNDPIGRLAAVFWPILLIYNTTESQFFQVGVLWFTVLITTTRAPQGNALAGTKASAALSKCGESLDQARDTLRA